MHKSAIVLMALIFSMPSFSAPTANSDSSKRSGFHIMCSAKPVINWLHKTDSASNFLMSGSQFEFQYSFRKHMLGTGLNFNRKKSTNYINNLPNEIIQSYLAISPYYSYKICSYKRWTTYAGVGYLYSKRDDLNQVVSPIETVSNEYSVTQEGTQLFFRFNYALNRRFSIELESAFYATRTRYTTQENYPLTPSMNYYNSIFLDELTYSVPSNLWLKYSF